MLVTVVDGLHDNLANISGFSLGIVGFLNESIEEFSTIDHFQHQPDVIVTVKDIVEANDMFVAELAEDLNLLCQALFVEFFHFGFVDDFNRIFVARLLVVSQSDDGKDATSKLYSFIHPFVMGDIQNGIAAD